jgi:hypothetical protein
MGHVNAATAHSGPDWWNPREASLAYRNMPPSSLRRPTAEEREIRLLNDERLLALVVAGRKSRNGEPWRLAGLAWRELAARYADRVLGWVQTFEFPGQPGVRVPATNEADAAQEAYERAVAMLGNFRGISLNEFRAALRTCTMNTCMDHSRRILARERHQAGSVDESIVGDDGSERGRFDAEIGTIEERREVGRRRSPSSSV